MISLWDYLPCEIQHFILSISKVKVARLKWRGSGDIISSELIDIINSTRTRPFAQMWDGTAYINAIEDTPHLYGVDGCNTLAAINFIKKHKRFFIKHEHIFKWQKWLNDLSQELWINEWQGGGQAATYNLIELASFELFTKEKFQLTIGEDIPEKEEAFYPHLEEFNHMTLEELINFRENL